MTKLLWMTIDRHPDSLKALIRNQLFDTGWEIFEVSYDSIDSLQSVPLESIDAVLLAPARHFPVSYMDRLTNCKLMQIWSSGYDKFNLEDANVRKLPVANNHGSNAVSVAEHTILMMLGVSRRAPEMHRRVAKGNWAGNDHGIGAHSLFGKTLGLVGLGRIGTLVAQRAEAFGMSILFSDPGVDFSPKSDWKKVSFDLLVERADYISLHVHLGPETSGMISTREFNLMRRQPFLINVSRAELIDREALLVALETEIIRGVGLDAHYLEPTEPNDPLLNRQDIFSSPHIAGSTIDSYRSTMVACIRNIQLALARSPIAGSIGGL